VHAELVDPAPAADGADAPPARVWKVSVNTAADSMRRQGLLGRKPKRRKGLTRQDRTAPKFGDLLKRDFTAPAPNRRWVGDMTEIPTDEGKLYLATVLDLFSRRLLSAPTSEQVPQTAAYDGTTVTSPRPVFRNLVDTLDVRFASEASPGRCRSSRRSRPPTDGDRPCRSALRPDPARSTTSRR
jgi:hypothetical protein